jgi:hypothetical protein
VPVLSYANGSFALGSVYTSNSLWSDAPSALAANGGARPRLYAPSVWSDGSSYSHLDEATYPAGNPNSLMTPQLSRGESVHDPGPIARGLFADLGWSDPTTPAQPTATPTQAPPSPTAATSTPTATPSPAATPLPGRRAHLPYAPKDATW